MKYEAYFKEFCKVHDYTGEYKHNDKTREYDIILTKEEEHAGAFLTEEEYKTLTMEEFKGALEMLHKGFKAKFNK